MCFQPYLPKGAQTELLKVWWCSVGTPATIASTRWIGHTSLILVVSRNSVRRRSNRILFVVKSRRSHSEPPLGNRWNPIPGGFPFLNPLWSIMFMRQRHIPYGSGKMHKMMIHDLCWLILMITERKKSEKQNGGFIATP